MENLAELYQTISKENPWSKCAPKSLLPADLREIEQLINDTLHALDDFLVERGRVYDIYGIKKPETLNEFEKSLSAFDIISSKNSELIDGDILKSGGKVYLYTKGFIHSKVIIIDDKISSTGSANMDLRSFMLNFEINAFIYDKEVIDEGLREVEILNNKYSKLLKDILN